jgi:hypothetical protein
MPLAEAGPRNARTDPESGMRFYNWEGVDYPSVTTLRRMAGLSFPLHQWAITQVVNRAVDNLSDLNRMVTTNDPLVLAAAKTWLRRASEEERDRAASLGKRVHSAAEEGKTIGQVDKDVVPYLRQYQHWLATTGFKVLRAEAQIYNLSKGYAGSFDILGEDKKKDVHIVDLKTGKGTYPEHALQATAYSMGEFIGKDDVIDVEATDLLRRVNTISLLHVTPMGWQWQHIDIDRYMVVAFNGLLAFAKWAHAHPKMDELLFDVTEGKAS